MEKITIDDFGKVEIRIGTILEATKVPDADRLLQLIFDFGPMPSVIANEVKQSSSEEEIASLSTTPRNGDTELLPELAEKYPGRDVRQIMSAIAPFVPDPSILVGKQIAVCTNLEPRKFRGYVSQGMIMATGDDGETLSFMVPEKKVKEGSKIH